MIALRAARPSLTIIFSLADSVTAFAVIFFMDFAQVRVGDVGVDLGRVDGGVAEELLDGADVGAVAEEVGREGVAERVRRDGARDARARDI
jgi:hypothetical protein